MKKIVKKSNKMSGQEKIDDILDSFVEFTPLFIKTLKYFKEYEDMMTTSEFSNLIQYIMSIIFCRRNSKKTFIGLYGKGKTTLIRKITYYISQQSIESMIYSEAIFEQNEIEEDEEDLHKKLENSKLVIFTDYYDDFSKMKKFTSGDNNFCQGKMINLSKFVIMELNDNIANKMDEATKMRQVRIELTL